VRFASRARARRVVALSRWARGEVVPVVCWEAWRRCFRGRGGVV